MLCTLGLCIDCGFATLLGVSMMEWIYNTFSNPTVNGSVLSSIIFDASNPISLISGYDQVGLGQV